MNNFEYLKLIHNEELFIIISEMYNVNIKMLRQYNIEAKYLRLLLFELN